MLVALFLYILLKDLVALFLYRTDIFSYVTRSVITGDKTSWRNTTKFQGKCNVQILSTTNSATKSATKSAIKNSTKSA